MAGVWLLSASILTGGRARRGGGGDWRKGVCVGGGTVFLLVAEKKLH